MANTSNRGRRADLDNLPPATMPAKEEPPPPRAGDVFKVRLRAQLDGALVDLTFDADLVGLRRTLATLYKAGAVFEILPLRWNLSAENAPICPQHGVIMQRKEKQGDEWFSHACHDEHGKLLWCRGFPGPHSPGWEHDAGHPDADQYQNGDRREERRGRY